jgi:hypothetical protein
MSNHLPDFIDTWLEAGAKSRPRGEPFQRLSATPKTVETVFQSLCRSTGLKPGVTEKNRLVLLA